MSMANETYFFIKDIKPGLKNLNLVFIVLEIGKSGPSEPCLFVSSSCSPRLALFPPSWLRSDVCDELVTRGPLFRERVVVSVLLWPCFSSAPVPPAGSPLFWAPGSGF